MSGETPERVTADAVARASIEMWRPYLAAIPGGWVDERGGAVAVVSGIPGTGFNGVWVEQPDTAPATVEELLDRVKAAAVPHCLQLRAGAPRDLEDLARERGMVLDGVEPSMVLTGPSSLEGALDVPGLTVEQLAATDGIVHARVGAHAFGTRVEVFEPAVTESILSVPGIRAYAGYVDGKPVSTAVGVTHGDSTGIIAVGTLAAHRGRGYAGAVTARAAADGFAAGASWVWLQSDPAAVHVYERLGFEAVDESAIWICE